MKLRFTIILACVLMILPQSMPNQNSANTPPASEKAGYKYDAPSKEVAPFVWRTSGLRFMKILNAAKESLPTINTARAQSDDYLIQSNDELYDQQKWPTEDLKPGNAALHVNISDIAREFRGGIDQATTDVSLSAAENPGVIYLTANKTDHNAYLCGKKSNETKRMICDRISTQKSASQCRSQKRGPFYSARVRTKIRGFPPRIKRGRRTNVWTVSPSSNWKIDHDTAKFNFKLLNKGCWKRRSKASWVIKSEDTLKLRVYITAERPLGRKCRARTYICFIEWR